MAQGSWDTALSGSSSNVNFSNLSPAVSRIVVQGSRGISSPDAPSQGQNSESDSDDEGEKMSQKQAGGAAGQLQINELNPVPGARAEAFIMPAISHAFSEEPTILNPMRVQLSPPSRPSLHPQEWTGGAMRVVDAVAALKSSGKVCDGAEDLTSASFPQGLWEEWNIFGCHVHGGRTRQAALGKPAMTPFCTVSLCQSCIENGSISSLAQTHQLGPCLFPSSDPLWEPGQPVCLVPVNKLAVMVRL